MKYEEKKRWQGVVRKAFNQGGKKKYCPERSRKVPARPSGEKYDGGKVEQWELEKCKVIIGQRKQFENLSGIWNFIRHYSEACIM